MRYLLLVLLVGCDPGSGGVSGRYVTPPDPPAVPMKMPSSAARPEDCRYWAKQLIDKMEACGLRVRDLGTRRFCKKFDSERLRQFAAQDCETIRAEIGANP